MKTPDSVLRRRAAESGNSDLKITEVSKLLNENGIKVRGDGDAPVVSDDAFAAALDRLAAGHVS